jgi:hypothetical protein
MKRRVSLLMKLLNHPLPLRDPLRFSRHNPGEFLAGV